MHRSFWQSGNCGICLFGNIRQTLFKANYMNRCLLIMDNCYLLVCRNSPAFRAWSASRRMDSRHSKADASCKLRLHYHSPASATSGRPTQPSPAQPSPRTPSSGSPRFLDYCPGFPLVLKLVQSQILASLHPERHRFSVYWEPTAPDTKSSLRDRSTAAPRLSHQTDPLSVTVSPLFPFIDPPRVQAFDSAY